MGVSIIQSSIQDTNVLAMRSNTESPKRETHFGRGNIE